MNIQLTFSNSFVKFCIVGVINTFLNYLIFLYLLLYLELDYKICGVCGFCIGGLVSFILNRRFTFKNKNFSFPQLSKFIFSQLLCVVIHTCILITCVAILNINSIIGQFFGLVVTTFVNFLFQKLWVFSK
jgi:putative flippase GtrA